MARFDRKDFRGDAVPSTITAPITALSTTWNIDDATGWPDGTNGHFGVVLNRKYGASNVDGTSPEEKVLVATRVGTTLTLADSSDRGADGTTPQAWSPPTAIEHCLFAQDTDEANETASQTLGQVQGRGDILTGKSANQLQRTAAGSDGSLWIVDASAPGGIRSSSLPDGAINSATMIVDDLIPVQKLAGLVMTAAEIDSLTGDDLFTGHQIYQQDTSADRPAQGLYTYNGFYWSPPWNLAWGLVAPPVKITAPTASIGSVAGDITGLTLTFTAHAHRLYKISVTGRFAKGARDDPATQVSSLFVTAGGLDRVVDQRPFEAGEVGTVQGWYIDAPAAGSVTYKARGAGEGGQVTPSASTTNPFVMTVRDVGPNGDPA